MDTTNLRFKFDKSKRLKLIPNWVDFRTVVNKYRKNLNNPGDCANDFDLLQGLAIAEAYIGTDAGWIPRVQLLGCKIAKLK